MRIYFPWLMSKSSLDDQITILNLVYHGKHLYVGRKWYMKCVEHGFIDDLDFHVTVSNFMFNPPFPELL